MKFQIITLMMFVTSLLYLNHYQPIEMHYPLIDDRLRINTNWIVWYYNISKVLFIFSLGFFIKKERLVDNRLYPTS